MVLFLLVLYLRFNAIHECLMQPVSSSVKSPSLHVTLVFPAGLVAAQPGVWALAPGLCYTLKLIRRKIKMLSILAEYPFFFTASDCTSLRKEARCLVYYELLSVSKLGKVHGCVYTVPSHCITGHFSAAFSLLPDSCSIFIPFHHP